MCESFETNAFGFAGLVVFHGFQALQQGFRTLAKVPHNGSSCRRSMKSCFGRLDLDTLGMVDERPAKGTPAKREKSLMASASSGNAILPWLCDLGTWRLVDAFPNGSGKGSLPRCGTLVCFVLWWWYEVCKASRGDVQKAS